MLSHIVADVFTIQAIEVLLPGCNTQSREFCETRKRKQSETGVWLIF